MIKIDRNDNLPIYQQIYEQIKSDIVSGNMAENFRLPSIRRMAEDLHVGKNSVENAYEQLVLEGYIRSIPGSGYRVNKLAFDLRLQSPESCAPARDFNICAENAPEIRYDFQYGVLGAGYFPGKIWRTYTANLLDEPISETVHGYCPVKGDELLRQELKHYLYRSRGVKCETDQIIICSGTQAALEIILRLFPKHHTIAMEDPGYDGARAVFHSHDLNILPISVTEQGIDLHTLSACPASMVYVAPSHQFPTGAVMPIKQRMELLKLAHDREMFVIEDDYDSEFRYKGQPIPALQSIDTDGQVIYIGTVSKILSAGLRMAYLILPKKLLPVYEEKYHGYACTVPVLEQKILGSFIHDGHWERQLRKVCISHKRKHDILISSIRQYMGEYVKIHGHHAGLHILLGFHSNIEEHWLVSQAAQAGILVCPASPFWYEPDPARTTALVLGYGKIQEKDIEAAIKLLGHVWFKS